MASLVLTDSSQLTSDSQHLDMKCSMVIDKDHASSSPIPMHCGESSKSWTKASKNCENKSKRLKSTKASRDQHSCANRGAAEHCISITNSDVTVNSLPVIQRVNLKETSQSSTNTLNESSVAAEKETINENEDSINKPADLLNSVGDEFRYTCGVCQKMFTNYVNMCRHRRLAHGTVTAKTKKAKQGPKDFETASVCSSASSQNNGSSRSQSPAVVKILTGSPAKVKAPARPQLTQQFQTVEISEKLLDPETLFYSKVASNIRENLLHHLDGKLECSDNVNKEKEPERSIAIDRPKRGEKILLKLDLVSSVALNGAPHNRMSLLAQSISSEVSKVSGRRDGLVHKVSWEKYNFPKNYDGRGDGLASYIKDMSHLDISTQLVMRQNLQRLNSEPTSPNTKDEIDNSDFDFPRGLCLMKNDVAKTESISTPSSPKPELSRTNSSPSVPSCMDVKDKSIIELDCPKSSGARRKSLSDLKVPALSSGSMQKDFPQDSALESAVELSGEWVRPRKYICGACGERFRDLYILEDHKYSVHPNVWCTHLEFEESTIAGMSFDDKSNSQLPFPGSLCRRFLNPTGALTSAIVVPPTKASESSCTKCSKVLNSLSDLHRHMLECGGDNTWMLTMVAASPSGGRRNRKWRPFGSRRRRQQGRRGMKRNIPSSPMKLPPYRARHRATDIDSIQRMISNLPAKRATRRVIQFSEDDIKTRSQATIHSVTFAPSLPRTHHKHTIGRHRLKSSANEALKFEVKKKKCAISRVLSAASAKKHSKPLSDLPLTEPAGLVVEKSSTFSDNGLVNNISTEQTLKQVPQIEDTDTSEASSKSKEKWQSSRNILSKKRLSVMKGKLPKTLLDKEDKSQEHIPTKSSATNAYTSSAVSEEKPAEKIGKGRGKKVVVSTKIMRKSLVSAKLRKKKSPVIPSKTHSLEAKDPSATHDILMTIVPRRSGRTASLTRDKDSAAEDKTVSSPVVDTELHSLPVPFHSASYAQEDEIKPISNASTSIPKESSNILETICAVPQEENNSEDKATRDLTSDIDNSRKIKLVGPGKGKKTEIGNANKKTKLKKKIEPEEKKTKGKGYTHPDDQISETNICEGCGLQFDNNSAYGRHMKTCIYVKKLENMSQPSIDATNIVSHQCNKCLEVFNLHTSLVEHSKVCTLANKESEVVKRKPGRPPKIKCIQNDDLNLLTTEEIKNPVHNNSDIKMPELQKEEPVVSVKRVGRPKKIKESSDEIPVLSPASKIETTTQANFTNNEILSKVKNKVVKRNHPKEAPRNIIKEDTPLTELLTTAKETIFDSLDEMKTENNDVIDSQELKHTRRNIELQNLDEDSSKDTALSYDEESKLSEQVLHMGDHFSLGGNRLLRARRDQGAFRKDTASRFGRRESRARSTRCNLSYEEMYTSSDVTSEADIEVILDTVNEQIDLVTQELCTEQTESGLSSHVSSTIPDDIPEVENIIAIELPLHLPPGLDPEVEALLSLGSEIQDRSNFWTNSEQVRSYNLPETQAHSNLLTAKPQICGIQDNCPILRKGNFTTETTINHDTVASQPSNQPQVVRTSAEPPSGVESVVDEPPKIFDAPDTKVIEIASKNSTGQKSYGGIDNRAGMTEPPEPVAVFSGTDHAVAILPDQPCWPDDASWQGTNIGWVPTNEVETSAEWTYGGAEWVPPETGPGASDIQWIQQEGTQFGIDQLQPISSLGSILDSVNQILNTGAGTSGEQVLLNEYGGFSSTLAAGSVMTGELVDLQRAMGATDEEMLMLQKLGEDGWPLENADLMDLDNQRSRAEGGVKEQEEEQEGEETSSPLPAKTSPKKTNQLANAPVVMSSTAEDGEIEVRISVSSIMMRRQRTEDRPFGHCQNILSQYEQKEMVCPLCNKHFLGLAALQTHVASTHNVREGPDKKMKTYERSRKAMIASIATTTLGQVINHRHMCVWCKELHVDEESLQRHVESTHSSEGSDGQELQATTRQV
uniref:C2H2-type domain-containing protein n=1 Tax=Timema genevievae TaxID=629358 RepID=A0A7R9PHF3_TIMGE|nr:unnamed protein product [Timema genevievae]